ncbi:MAG: hypothetical protein AAGC67_07935 [Myxococcota bacterium]
MGKTCAWCGRVLQTMSGPPAPAPSQALCRACLKELQSALSTNGLRTGDREAPSN